MQPVVLHRVMDTVPASAWYVVQVPEGLTILVAGLADDSQPEVLIVRMRQELDQLGVADPVIRLQRVGSIPRTPLGRRRSSALYPLRGRRKAPLCATLERDTRPDRLLEPPGRLSRRGMAERVGPKAGEGVDERRGAPLPTCESGAVSAPSAKTTATGGHRLLVPTRPVEAADADDRLDAGTNSSPTRGGPA
ncbi:MAG: hypothetical protein DCC50_06975 [Acidobacteria bacterium]|nr:MAG: hypothetical protein DCC50_06975 [Acidobacteriota bacterium]